MGAHAMHRPQDMGHMQKESSNLGMAFILGAAIGAISGLLFAPRAGREMRDELKHKADDMNRMAHDRIDQAKDKAHQMTDKMKSKTDEGVDYTNELEDRGRDAVDNLDARSMKNSK